MSNLAPLLTRAFIGAIFINLMFVLCYIFLSREPRYAPGSVFPPIAGVGLDGRMQPDRVASCYLIRVTADNCEYCKADQPAYTRIVEAAHGAGCDTLSLAPLVGLMAPRPDGDVRQLGLVTMEFGASLYPSMTPQTILLDGDRRVIWSVLGALANGDASDGIEAITALSGSSNTPP